MPTTVTYRGKFGSRRSWWRTSVDRLGLLAAYGLVSATQTAAVGGFLATGQLWVLYAGAIVYGFGFGGVMTALVCAVRAAVPRRNLGSTMAFVSLLAWIGIGAGGYHAGLCFDLTGSYGPAFVGAALAGVANLVVFGALALLVHRGHAARPIPIPA